MAKHISDMVDTRPMADGGHTTRLYFESNVTLVRAKKDETFLLV
jgi:hypothetical protein